MSRAPQVSDEWLAPIIEELTSAKDLALIRSRAVNGSLWSTALELKVFGEEMLLATISSRLRTPVAHSLGTNPQAKALVPERVARKFQVLPLAASSHTLDVATSNPWDLDAERAVSFASGRSVRMWLASPPQLAARIDEEYPGRASQSRQQGTAMTSSAEPVVKLVDRIVASGIEQRASDIHLEPEEDGIAVRYRVDGILRHAMLLPKPVGVPLVSRIKIMAKMDIADRLRPQGGHASVGVGATRVDLRVSTLPASHGEKVVIRILDPRSAVRSLDSLGLDDLDSARVARLLEIREGMVLVTGPTGSGKTTTLYAALKEIQRRGLNIITVEDPVEYRIPGIVQVQINEKAGLSFASALRSILRQDPDVVLIGEIRDRETAAIAVQASLTGHLVFATLHTNDAASTISRLSDLGVDVTRLSAGLKGIISQRLIRRLCTACRTVANDGAPVQLRRAVRDSQMVYAPVGCEACTMSGYHGRVAVTEIVIATPLLERAIAAGESVESLTAISRRDGSRSLGESALAHLIAGETSGDELLRALDGDSIPVLVDSGDEYTPAEIAPLTDIVPGVVDVYVIRPLEEGWQVLTLQRAVDTRCPGAWETVHGRLDEGERPADGAVREVREETGLQIERLYNVTVQPFYLHTLNTVQLAIVFAAFVNEPAEVELSAEHQKFEWLSPHDASSRFIWPREKEALSYILHLLAGGSAGPVEDVLRVL